SCPGQASRPTRVAPDLGLNNLGEGVFATPVLLHSKIELVPLVPPYIEALHPYEAGRTIESVRQQYGLSHIAKLASNENPLGASPKAIEAMRRALSGLNLYPNGGLELREVLAGEYDLKVENVIAGSGSEGIMSSIIRAFLCDEDEVLTTDAAFIGFQV